MRTTSCTSSLRRRTAATALSASVLLGLATPALADERDSGDVDVTVDIEATTEPGVLAMTLAGSSVQLAEDGSTPLIRQFTGALPTVTVTDTRDPDTIPDGVFWYVLGSATEFVGDSGQDPIGAGHLGWEPALIDGGDSGLVAAGDEVLTVLDDETLPGNNVGLVDQELLAMAADSEAVAGEGRWTVTADLFLRTEATVAAGEYASVLTLSLFE